MKMNRRMLFGIISIALAAVIALVGIPAVIGQTNTKINIVRVVQPIDKGTMIPAEALEIVEISSHGLPANVATDMKQVVGYYALVDLVPGDYFLPSKVGAESPDKDPILSKLPDDKIAISMSVQSLAGILSNKLRTDDIVAIYSYNEDGEIEVVEELQYVRIIAISNSNGTNIDDAVGDESRMASTITFLVEDLQAQKMISIENENPMHLVLVSRGDVKHAKELLNTQDEILDAIREKMEEEESFEEDEFEFEFTFPDNEAEGWG